MTQLYVSVDASTKDSLKKIDRPLFRDFWPRFLDSLKALADKVTGSDCSAAQWQIRAKVGKENVDEKELAWRRGCVMDCHATAHGSIPIQKPSFTSFARDSKWGRRL